MQDPEPRTDESAQPPASDKSVLIETLQLALRNQEATVVGKLNTFLAQNFKGMDEAKSPFRISYSVREIPYLWRSNECMRNMIKYLEEADVEHVKKTYKKGTAQECISDFRR